MGRVTMHSLLPLLLLCLCVGVHGEDDLPVCQPGDHVLPNTDDCTGFYFCSTAGEAIAQDCPAGLYFDPVHLVCNWPDNVDCIDDSPETLECMDGETACLLSSEEDGEEDDGKALLDFDDLRRTVNDN